MRTLQRRHACVDAMRSVWVSKVCGCVGEWVGKSVAGRVRVSLSEQAMQRPRVNSDGASERASTPATSVTEARDKTQTGVASRVECLAAAASGWGRGAEEY